MSSSHQAMEGLAGAFIGISTIVVCLRGFARYARKARLGPDDWTMFAAYILFIGFMTGALYGTHHRTLGYSTPELKSQPVLPKLSVTVNRIINSFAAAFFGCVKASALLFFQRVFCIPGRNDAFKRTTQVLLVLTALWAILYILLPIFQCGTNVANAWGPVADRKKYCHIANPYQESLSVSDVVFDAIILVLPIPKIWRLNMNVRRRLGIILIFSTAIVSLAASLAKTVIVFKPSLSQVHGDEQLGTTQVYFMWVLEGGFAILSINLPTLIWLKQAKAPENMLKSVRSVLSIRSHGSGLGNSPDAPRNQSKDEGLLVSMPKEKRGLNNGDVELGLVPSSNTRHLAEIETTEVSGRRAQVPKRGIQVTQD